MALMDENGGNGFVMPVAPYGNGGGNCNGSNGGWGNQDGWWFIVLIILFAAGGWGNGYGGGRGSDGGQPIIINDGSGSSSSVQRGFDQAAIMGSLNALPAQLCNGFNGVTSAITGAQNALAAQMYSNELSGLNRSFAAQTAFMQGQNALAAQLAQCCCDNQLATANLQSTIVSEGCSDREALNYATRDIINNQNSGIQRILDRMYEDKLSAKDDIIAQLRSEVTYNRGVRDNEAQTARIIAGQNANVDILYNRLSNCPVPSVPVYGSQPIFTCRNNGCNTSCNSGCNSACGF